MDLGTRLMGINPKLCIYSREPRSEVYCLRLNIGLLDTHGITGQFCDNKVRGEPIKIENFSRYHYENIVSTAANQSTAFVPDLVFYFSNIIYKNV